VSYISIYEEAKASKEMSDFKSIGDILRGDGSNDGFFHRFQNGWSITDGPTKDERWPGGRYTSVTDVDNYKQSIVRDSSGNIVYNSGWKKR
jgi:hypothetical protein